ncbi:uncharacterized protein C15orf39 homolog isoform X1 [Pleurodeles waltl]|uniref:uncharacterized protein C15orf39 homolog isoform X1 n=1 Tax=Pleurodeles waltl TaxID=8319 RepID=UPI0037094533
MAGKRQLSSLDPVMYSKTSRLDTQPDHTLSAGLLKPNPVPGYTPEDLLAFKNSYLTYPEASENTHNWSSTAAYLHYAGNALNQHLRSEGMLMKSMLYKPDGESLKTGLPAAEKGRTGIVRDLLIGRDKRSSLLGRQDHLRQVQSQNFSLQKPAGVPLVTPSSSTCVPLAMPQPIYRNSVCCLETGYSPRGPMSLGSQAEKTPKQRTGGEWMLPSQISTGNAIMAGDQRLAAIASMQKKAQQLDSLMQPHPGLGVHTKDMGRITSEYASLQPNFEQFKAPQGPSFPDARYSVPYESPKRAQDVHQGSTVQKEWTSQHPFTTSPLHSHVPSHPDRPLHHSLLAAQGEARLFHPGDPLALRHSGSAFVPQSQSNYNGFCLSGSTDPRTVSDPRMFCASYLSQQGPRSHYFGPLETYPYRPTAAAQNNPSGHMNMSSANAVPIDTHVDPKIHNSSGYKQDFLQQSTTFAFAPPDLSLFGSNLINSNLHTAQPMRPSCRVGAPHRTPPAKEAPGVRTTGSHNSAFHPVNTANSSGKVAEGLLKGDMSYRSNPRQIEKQALSRQSRSMGEMRRLTLSSDERKSKDVSIQEPAKSEAIIIDDSTSPERIKVETSTVGTMGMSPKTPSVLSTPPRTFSPTKEGRASISSVQSTSPSSPPMPVINNVFSLAPYRAYLEGTAEHPFAKRHKVVEPPAEAIKKETVLSAREGHSPKFVSEQKPEKNPTEAHLSNCTESNTPNLNSASKRVPEGSIEAATLCIVEKDQDKNFKFQQAEPFQQKCHFMKHEHTLEHKNVISSTSSLQQTSTKLCKEIPKEGEVLDLSLKKSPSLVQWSWNPDSTENARREESEREVQGDLRMQKVDTQLDIKKTEPSENPTPPSSSRAVEKSYHPGTEGSFHSSAAFMFKKYKILKLAPSGGDIQQNNQPEQQSTHPLQQIVRILPQPTVQPLTLSCFQHTSPDVSNTLPPKGAEVSQITREVSETNCKPDPTSCSQYFTELHLSLCTFISRYIAETSPQTLLEWLRRAASDEEPKEKPKSPIQPKNGTQVPHVPRTSKVREIWLCFEGLPVLLNKVLSQLETFILVCKCPFPHVVRAGAIFIPIHLVKEKLFPGLSVSSVDRVLQEHKVELRPTTLSEEKLLRETELKGCSLRLLKLLALKQLPDIYPDLLDLHWYSCIRQQLGDKCQDTLDVAEKIESLEQEATVKSVNAALTKTPREAGKRRPKVVAEPVDAFAEPENEDTEPKAGVTEPEGGVAKPEEKVGLAATKNQTLSEETEEIISCHPGKNGSRPQSLKRKTKPLTSKLNKPTRPSGIKSRVFQSQKLCRSFQLKLKNLSNSSKKDKDCLKIGHTSCAKPARVCLKKAMARTARKTLSTSKVLHLRNSVVQIKFQQVLPVTRRPKQPRVGHDCVPLHKPFRQKRRCVERATKQTPYPELVGKRIRHLYEENDKTEAWYEGVVLGIYQQHPNPLKIVFEVRYDSEPKWRYYLELLQDFENGWLELDE